MWSDFPRNLCTSARIGGQVLTLEGQTCSLERTFTSNRTPIFPYRVSVILWRNMSLRALNGHHKRHNLAACINFYAHVAIAKALP